MLRIHFFIDKAVEVAGPLYIALAVTLIRQAKYYLQLELSMNVFSSLPLFPVYARSFCEGRGFSCTRYSG